MCYIYVQSSVVVLVRKFGTLCGSSEKVHCYRSAPRFHIRFERELSFYRRIRRFLFCILPGKQILIPYFFRTMCVYLTLIIACIDRISSGVLSTMGRTSLLGRKISFLDLLTNIQGLLSASLCEMRHRVAGPSYQTKSSSRQRWKRFCATSQRK